MQGPIDPLYRLQRCDASRAGVMLAASFAEDPIWQALFGQEAASASRYATFETPIRYCLSFGQVWAISAALEGIVAWLPAHRARMSIAGLLWSGAIWSGLRMSPRLGVKTQSVFQLIEKDRDAHMRGKIYLYLLILGVAPAWQGQGLGSRLLRAAIAQSEQEGLPLYLETETERNVAFYARHGFRTIQQVTLPIVNLPMWELIREPGAQG